MELNVYILTHCSRVQNLHGTLLTFKTLRTGFPKAHCHVVDNCSLVETRPTIKAAAEECDAYFTQLEEEVWHFDFIGTMLASQAKGTAIFLDPDLCFWENVENWTFGNALMAGRLIPRFRDSYTKTITHPRIHTSFLWFPDASKMLEKIWELKSQYGELSPFAAQMFRLDGIWQRFDTASLLYNALFEQCHIFTKRELDAYDHLFCGTHADAVVSSLGSYARMYSKSQQLAQTDDYKKLKGIWKIQERFFKNLAPQP